MLQTTREQLPIGGSFAYIKTFKPTQPALKDIPLLSQMAKEGGQIKE